MLFEHLGQEDVARRTRAALVRALRSDVRTRDLGGSASTDEFADQIIEELG